MEGLSIGRIVRYSMAAEDFDLRHAIGDPLGDDKKTCRAAVVVAMACERGDEVNLFVFPDGKNDGHAAPFWKSGVLYSEGKETGTWHWPERTGQPAALSVTGTFPGTSEPVSDAPVEEEKHDA